MWCLKIPVSCVGLGFTLVLHFAITKVLSSCGFKHWASWLPGPANATGHLWLQWLLPPLVFSFFFISGLQGFALLFFKPSSRDEIFVICCLIFQLSFLRRVSDYLVFHIAQEHKLVQFPERWEVYTTWPSNSTSRNLFFG